MAHRYYNCSYKYFNWALGSNFNNIKSTDALAYRSRAEDYIAKSFEYYDKALEMTEDYSQKAHIYCDIGEVWLENWDLNRRDYSKALKFFNKSLENNLLSVNNKKAFFISVDYTNIGITYIRLKDFKKAAKFFILALEKAENTSDYNKYPWCESIEYLKNIAEHMGIIGDIPKV